MSEPHDTSHSAVPGLPRLLAGLPARGVLNLQGHLALHGELALSSRPRAGEAAELIELVDRAGLRGRGGAGFPTAAKLRAVVGAHRSALGGRPLVAINAVEGEPASSKDRTLLARLPHLVLDGGALAARAVGAREVFLCIGESAPEALDSAAGAIAERERLPLEQDPSFRLVVTPNHYVAGQESALVNHLNGGWALPTFTPPLPLERGVRGRPTLVSNAETLAHLALIARHGPRWFRELGTAAQPGSALLTLSGDVPHPGVYEIEYGSPLTTLIEAAGGLQSPLRAVLVGGYAGTWIDGGALRELALSDDHLAAHGASLGAGVVVLLSAAACPVAELVRVIRWLATQSARQCGPCVFGLDAIATLVEQILAGAAPPGAERRLTGLGAQVRGRGACRHPDGAARLLASALDVFAEEFAAHARQGPCAACRRPSELPRPRRRISSQSADRPAERSRTSSWRPSPPRGIERSVELRLAATASQTER
jgi:NADH:ubiquinone oxidoreductase subunit F (NADH-binding)